MEREEKDNNLLIEELYEINMIEEKLNETKD